MPVMHRTFLRHIRPLWLRQKLYFHSAARNRWPETRLGVYDLEFAPVGLRHFSRTDHGHRQIAWLGVYELPLSRRIASLARAGGLLVDVGANIGYFSLMWAGLHPKNRVLAFEPSPTVNQMLRANVTGAACRDRVEVFDCALGKVRGPMCFDPRAGDESGWGGLVPKPTPRTQEVAVERLDDLAPAGVTIDALKIDAEGADAWVLTGAEQLLRARRVRHVFFERNRARMTQLGIEWNEPIEFLQGCGYRVVRLGGDIWTSHTRNRHESMLIRLVDKFKVGSSRFDNRTAQRAVARSAMAAGARIETHSSHWSHRSAFVALLMRAGARIEIRRNRVIEKMRKSRQNDRCAGVLQEGCGVVKSARSGIDSAARQYE
jgi:FkbM family methyltransferase